MKKTAVLGVDIGGSHITAALVDLESGTLIAESIKRNPVNSKQEKTAILEAWCNVIEQAFAGANGKEKYIGIAMPGPFDYEKGISLIKEQDKFNDLYLVNVKEELASRLQLKPSAIHFVNDAAGFMQGEVFSGAAKGHRRVLGLTLGTGLGSALSVNGVASDAELWNSVFLDGIAEDYLSARWFTGRYSELGGKSLDGVRELAALVATDALAKQVFTEFGANLAQFLVPIIKKHGAEVVILGGNIAQAFDFFALSLNIGLSKQGLNISIKLSELNEHAALIGAASNWNPEICQTANNR